MRTPIRVVLLTGAGVCLSVAEEPAPDFNRDVRPILSQYCFKCHGMDDKGRKGELRLDTREAALSHGKSGQTAVVPGHPETSEIVRRLHSEDPEEQMPPPSTKTKLSRQNAAVLERWVRAGAPYSPHWAFVAPSKTPVPSCENSNWPKNPIDSFVLARLQSEGLSPSPEANKATLLRRVYLDLTGLPPAPEDLNTFLSDTSPNAYEAVVERLLASPRYGERWARRWLDLARYADTNGYEKDRQRTIWPYRDWVVNALNEDMPFDMFSIRQLAGDLLPNATAEDRIATGFHRNTMLNEEGGIDPLEFRYHAVADRVGTTGTAWLGLTVACAQCHTHKYDPILHTDYYRLMAFFNNAEEPDFAIPSEQIAKKREEILQKIETLQTALPEKFALQASTVNKEASSSAETATQRRQRIEERFEAWEKEESEKAIRWEVARPRAWTANLARLQTLPDASILASGDVSKSDTYTLDFLPAEGHITGVRLEVLPDASLPAEGPGRAYYEGPKGDFFLSEIQFQSGAKPLKVVKATDTYSKGGIGGSTKVGAAFTIDGAPETGWATNGAQGKENAAVYQFESPVNAMDGIQIHMLFERHYACPLGRFRISFTRDTKPLEARPGSDDLVRALVKPRPERTPAETALVRSAFFNAASETEAARKEIESLRAGLPRLQTTMVMQERPADHPRETHLHNRGEFTQPRERVFPGVPAFLPPLPAGAQPDRLTFARWLFSPEHPLTSRVAVNREWQALFGRGLVRTTEDFGYQGDTPIHQDLLDWLAVEFRTSGWSLKKLHRLIVTSATYRQSSALTPALAARDPQNTLLARAPKFRLDAEIIRDSALQVSGLLSLKMGGPGVYPSQNPMITKEGTYGAFEWKPSPGEDRYRRTLYTFIKRTAPFAMTGTFDAPTGESCVARRELSNSPLQALTLLNDVIFQETAQALGKRCEAQAGDDRERIQFLFRTVLTRDPSEDESTLLAGFLHQQRERMKASKTEAEARSASWAALSRAVLNLDEAITKN